MAGQICLLKSVFTAIPLFYLSVFKAPATVHDRISSLQRKFLWAWGKETKTISWVSWKNVCRPQEEGGLGIKEIRSFNTALLAKWKWRIMSDEGGKWKDILLSKYGTETGRGKVRQRYQSWWWKDLAKVCGEGVEEEWFHKAILWKVGDGGLVRFWEDTWLQNNSLKVLYPRLYSLSLDQGKKVEEVGGWEDGRWRWRLNWRRDRHEWESNLEGNMLSSLNTGVICQDSHDHLVWRKDPAGIFSVKSAYSILANHQDIGEMEGVFSTLWQAKAPPKVLLTAWRVLHDRIPTRVNLYRRGVPVISPLCPFCSLSEESSQHLFLDCAFAQQVWSRCYRWLEFWGSITTILGTIC